MELFFGWAFISVIVGAIGSDRKIGFWGGFLFSLLLSPVIGLIIVLVSKSNSAIAKENYIIHQQQQQAKSLKKLASDKEKQSLAQEIEKLQKLKEENVITEEEFTVAKSKLLK